MLITPKPLVMKLRRDPMTDTEIRGIIFDGFLGGTDTVSKFFKEIY